jgi:hypothetical protein
MNYIIILSLIVFSCFFAVLTFKANDSSRVMFMTATAFLFLITGLLIFGYGIEVPIGTITELVR